MTVNLNEKINEHFAGLVVRKDLTKIVKGNAIVPSFVLEYLLGQYCASDDEEIINDGVETVKNILSKHYVHRNEAELVKSTIKEKGRHKIIDRVTASLNTDDDCYEVTFSNLGLKKVVIGKKYIKNHPKLLVGGVWCLVDMEYEYTENKNQTPWIIDKLKPIQVSHFDLDQYLECRKEFTTEEWIDLLMQSIGFNPEFIGRRNKLHLLVRLISFCERNYNLIELGPKGTGKSHIFSEFSPHGIVISGGEVTAPKLFVSNASGKIGLVGYWDTVAFDEFAGTSKKVDKNLVDIMKNYMANKSFSRGRESLGAEASMVFLGNTKRSVAYMLKCTDLFEELPDKYHDPAYLDRLHFYIPGWEIDILRGELFTDEYGFVVDYLAEILRHFRNVDYSNEYSKYFELSSDIATRDRTAILKTFSGLTKILYPNLDATKEEVREILEFAIEGRKRIKDQLLVIDPTFNRVEFSFNDIVTKKTIQVKTLEETQYPKIYRANFIDGEPETHIDEEPVEINTEPAKKTEKKLKSGEHLIVKENAKGYSYKNLFADHLQGAKDITIYDPYIIKFYQARNLMDFLTMLLEMNVAGEEIDVKLVTRYDAGYQGTNEQYLKEIEQNLYGSGVNFSFEFNEDPGFHARSIVTDTGWKISLDRGLDIFQQFDTSALGLAGNLQTHRLCKAFEVTYLRVEE